MGLKSPSETLLCQPVPKGNVFVYRRPLELMQRDVVWISYNGMVSLRREEMENTAA